MAEAKDIDNINNVRDMLRIMDSLNVSCEDLQTLDEMKRKVKETLKMSEKKSSWMAKEAFSVLTEAKEEDERKRETLYEFYEKTEDCLNNMDSKVRTLLEQNIGNLTEKIAMNKRELKQKEYIVLVAGETSSGKSTLLNLILGEQLLPYSHISTTSTICELKYGTKPKLVAHFKDKDPVTGLTKETVWLGQSMETSQQSCLDEISKFVHMKVKREKGSDYKKIELFWPHSLLKQGIVMVDSPGIGESDIMDKMVEEYLPEAFAFIYVINSANAGGIQKDRIEKLIGHATKVSLEHQEELIEHARSVSFGLQKETSATRALFVCNKWDQVPPREANEVKRDIITKLTKCLPSLQPESQIIYMSSTNASEAQDLGAVTDDFAGLMDGIKSMVLKSIEARLQTQWRWLDYLLLRMAFHTEAFIRNSEKDRSKVNERMELITKRLAKIEKQESSVKKELQEYLDNETNKAVSKLSKYLKSSDVTKQFTSWTLDDVPNSDDSWELVTTNCIQKAFMKRLKEVIAAWEESTHVFADARTSLIQYFQQRFNFVEGQLRNLESSVLADDDVSHGSVSQDTGKLSRAERVINYVMCYTPNWISSMVLYGIAAIGTKAAMKKLEDLKKTREFKEDKCGFMAKASKEYLAEAAEEKNLRLYVVEQLKESQVCLKQVVTRIPELIEADKILFQQLRDEKRSKKEIKDLYKPLYKRSSQLGERVALFGIKDVRTMDISCSDLEWKDDGSSLLGTGAFATVYRGKLKRREGEQPVALKIWKEELNESNAKVFLAETETLSIKLNHPFIVKFYGAALLNEGDQLKPILVMELCKENLMTHIFMNPKNIPGMPASTRPTDRNTIRWAKDIANALDFIHKQGIVHRDVKLDNILITHEGVVKIADVGVSKQANMITGTMAGTPAYVAPEVIRSSVYDSKADVYSFGIIMWEMWYGKRAFYDVGRDLNTFLQGVASGVRPSHVEGRRMPPDGWRHLMQWCWDGEAGERPTAATCNKELIKLFEEAIPAI
ncbi:uncharacterized protein LOC144662656 [Oculina patagonica]